MGVKYTKDWKKYCEKNNITFDELKCEFDGPPSEGEWLLTSYDVHPYPSDGQGVYSFKSAQEMLSFLASGAIMYDLDDEMEFPELKEVITDETIERGELSDGLRDRINHLLIGVQIGAWGNYDDLVYGRGSFAEEYSNFVENLEEEEIPAGCALKPGVLMHEDLMEEYKNYVMSLEM